MKTIPNLFRLGLALSILALTLAVAPRAQAAGATITVTGATDNATVTGLHGNSTCDLREAVENANANSQLHTDCAGGSATPGDIDTIEFAIGTGAEEIDLAAALPDIQDPVIFDGTTQPLYGTSPLIRLDGGTTVSNGLRFMPGSEGSTVKGLMITRFMFAAIFIDAGDSTAHVTVVGNFIGTDGTNALGSDTGIYIYGGNYAQIGGFAAADRNVISGNSTNIFISGNSSLSQAATNNVIRANYIGLSADGTARIGTPGNGIAMTNTLSYGANNNRIQFNRIAGGSLGEIQIQGADDDNNLIQGNFIGTNANGTAALGDGTGIVLSAGHDNVIGGNGDIGKRNLIAGHSNYEISIQGGSGTVIADNVLGMAASGTAQIDSSTVGILVTDAAAQIARNWIGVGGNGISLAGTATLNSGSSNNCLLGNLPEGLTNSTGTAVIFDDNWWGSDTGPHNATLNNTGTGTAVSDDVDFDPWALSAQAICSPFANFAISSLGFGNQLVGTSRILKFSVFSAGTKPLHLSSLGAPAAPFSVVPSAGTCSTSTPLAVGSNCQIAVKFAPTATGSFSSSLGLVSDSVPPAVSLPLTGKGIAGTQLLKNPGFETDANLDKKPDNWSYSNFIAATDKRDCSVHKSGTCSLKFQGNGTQKVASQTIFKSGVAGDDFTFALWSKASSVPVGSVYRLQVLFYNNSTLKATKTMNFNVGTHLFQKVSGTFTASTAYTKIVYRIQFKAASGTAWFDAADLRWAP